MQKSAVLMIALTAILALAGCQDRVIWNDNGKAKEATEGREVWNTQGKMESGERKIWKGRDDEPVVE